MKALKNYKQRSSSLGNIITKSGKVTQGMTTYLSEKFVEITTGHRKEITSKYFEKGIASEQAIIDLVNKYFFKKEFITDNKKQFENQYITGTPDLIHNGFVFDIKSAWDQFTFQKASLSWMYEWQLRAYMNLLGLNKAFLVYGLVDMPEHLMRKEKQSLFYQGGIFEDYDDPNYIEACKELEARYTFSHLPIHQRLKVWEIDAKEDDSDVIQNAVEISRVMLMTMLEEQKANERELERVKRIVNKNQK